MQIVTYLGFEGNCREAFTFYETALRGKIVAMFTYDEMPGGEQACEGTENMIMHARLVAGDAVLMGSDGPPQYREKPQGFHVSLMVDEPAEADRLFDELSAGGEVVMAIQETFWAKRFAMFTDRFGIPWMINCEKPRE